MNSTIKSFSYFPDIYQKKIAKAKSSIQLGNRSNSRPTATSSRSYRCRRRRHSSTYFVYYILYFHIKNICNAPYNISRWLADGYILHLATICTMYTTQNVVTILLFFLTLSHTLSMSLWLSLQNL